MEIRNHVYNFSVEPKATGKRIKELRKSKGMTAQDLADALICSVKTVSSWETGIRFPSIDNLVDLANFFDVTVHSLMLPNDNCSVGALSITPSHYAKSPTHWKVYDADDDKIASLFIRRDYLIQRLLSGFITIANKNEFHYVDEQLFDGFWIEESFEKVKTMINLSNDPKGYYDFIKLIGKRDIKCIKQIFNRLWYGDKLTKTLESLNKFDKDCLFTTALYMEELRDAYWVKYLYEVGARFIGFNISGLKEKMDVAKADNEQCTIVYKKLFKYNIFSEDDMDEYLCTPDYYNEEQKNNWYHFGEKPRYSENPAYYDGHEVSVERHVNETDVSVREKISECYFLLEYIKDNVGDYEDYVEKIIPGDKLEYREYVKMLIKK